MAGANLASHDWLIDYANKHQPNKESYGKRQQV